MGGSDVSAFEEGHPCSPFLSGHEWGGTAPAVGGVVPDLHVGDCVFAGAPPAWGRCGMCRAGHAERCAGLTAPAFGTHPLTPRHGAYGDRITVPAEMLIRIPDAVDDGQAAMVEPATVALHAVRRRPPELGATTVLLGRPGRSDCSRCSSCGQRAPDGSSWWNRASAAAVSRCSWAPTLPWHQRTRP
ncbi:hypothetical protein SipoB123_32725 [Streptomyces ipomoeae]|nr:hypothetical protein SipoB123_32725 [Streptomyces ipomoeae]